MDLGYLENIIKDYGIKMSKGSTPRPFSVAQEQYNERWDLIFGRDKGQKERDKEFDKAQDALERMAENARELGLNYEGDK
jgi:hypothetical protein